jgi:hypothetical protein
MFAYLRYFLGHDLYPNTCTECILLCSLFKTVWCIGDNGPSHAVGESTASWRIRRKIISTKEAHTIYGTGYRSL